MKSLVKMVLSCAAIGAALIFTSCSSVDEPVEPPIKGVSVFLPNSLDSSVTVTLEFDEAWQVSNNNSWFDVSPTSGQPGIVELTVSGKEVNQDLREREGFFFITTSTGTATQNFVFQEPMPGWNVAGKSALVSSAAQSYTFSVQGNMDFEAKVADGVDWVTIDSVTESDSTLLSDDSTYSMYRTYNINVTLTANEDDVRTALISLNGVDGETTDEIEISQIEQFAADYSKVFYRRSLGFRVTATSCGNCPKMAHAMKQAYEETNGRFVPFYIYGMMSPGDSYIYEYWDYWYEFFDGTGFPIGVVNGYAECNNAYSQDVQIDFYKAIAEEAVTELPANNAIGGIVVISNGTLNVDISIASKEAGTYTLGAFLLENGVIGYQSGAGENYEHNYVLREGFTPYDGEQVSVSANSILELTYSMPVPTSVENIENCHVCVWIAEEGTFEGSVTTVEGQPHYKDYGMLIDNVVEIPVNGYIPFEYED